MAGSQHGFLSNFPHLFPSLPCFGFLPQGWQKTFSLSFLSLYIKSLLPQVDVVEPQGKVVKLGALSIGQTVKKIVTIANNSAAPLTFKLSLMSTMPELQEAGVRLLPSLESTLVCLQVAMSCSGWELVANYKCILSWLPVCCPVLPAGTALPADTCNVNA